MTPPVAPSATGSRPAPTDTPTDAPDAPSGGAAHLGGSCRPVGHHPGVNQRTAELLLAEIGADMSRFPSAAHLASWAKVSPGNNESAGKRFSGATGHGNRWLRTGIVQAAWAAVKVKKSYLSSFYHRLAGRRGAKRAIFAVAHRMLTARLSHAHQSETYHDLGATYLDERDKTNLIKRTVKRFAQLGYQVNIEPIQPVAA